ncbi:MAG: peptidoglycan DD-metalloendopeptidase family protein [Lachnospiraceae bacterium]|nr:peptidoglycan DD-metalloendopeptidase family protein [Lachnospiraceae bacterium]
MKKITKYHKRVKLTFAVSAFLCCLLMLLLFNSVGSFAAQANYYVVKIDGQVVGCSNSKENAETALFEARKRLSKEADSIVYLDSKFTIEPEHKFFGKTDQTEDLSTAIYEQLKEYTDLNYVQGICISAGKYSITVNNPLSATMVLRTLESQYDEENEYTVNLISKQNDDYTEITYEMVNSSAMEERIAELMEQEGLTKTAADAQLHQLKKISFVDTLQISQVYTDKSAVFSGDDAVQKVLSDGSAIGVCTTKLANYDEEFDLPIQYIEDDDMYEGQSYVVYDGTSGTRNVTAYISYVNGKEKSRNIIQQTVYTEPTAAIIRTGVLPSPEFVVPLDNCFISSGFGYRWGSLHTGNDYACGYGEPIYASAPGYIETVTHSDEGYGNNVVMRHDDHLQTRYAHMSETACEEGQYVQRFEIIGYAGSTGNSTGNHCHFEIIQDGVPIDPFTYLEGEGLEYYPDE